MSRMLRKARLIGALLLSLLVLGCGSDNATLPSSGVGLVVFSNGWVGVMNPATQTVSTPFLVGDLGAAGDGAFDVVITPDRKTALVSSFGSSTVYFIDLSNLSAPSLRGSVTLSFFAEDIALTPDGRYALVTDGGFSPRIAVIDVRNRTLVEEYVDPDTNPDPDIEEYAHHFQAVAVAADGKTVLTVDYFNQEVNTLTIDDAGHLTYVGNIDVSNGGTLWPVNVSISPDGKTAIVAVVASADAPAVSADNMRFPVLQITAPGVVAFKSFVVTAARINASQSIVFNPSGTKAYVLSNPEDPDPLDTVFPTNAIVGLNVAGPGVVTDSGTTTSVDFVGTSQLFGVDTLAIDLTGRYLVVSNMTLSGALSELQVVDVTTGSAVKTISFDDVEMPPASGTFEKALPMGVFIR
jgi:hypothetical protein